MRGLRADVRAFRWPWLLANVLGWCVVLGMIAAVCAPLAKNLRTLGFHDWDQMEAHRYLVVKTIRDYHEFPFWNPYGCGGHPSWGGLESGTTVVSPWLLPYLFLKLGPALRVEVVGMALISAIGTWLLAGRFTRSAGVRAFVCAVFVVNGRWALQAATGHTWHLYYAWTPWVFYFFDVACSTEVADKGRRARNVVLAGAAMAMMVYGGGIYPLPHTAVLLCIYAVVLAVVTRREDPLLVLGAVAVLAFGFSAPKLLPVIEMLGRYPRLVTSTESIDIGTLLTILTSRDQGVASRPANVPNWGWQEYGMFIGWGGVVALVCGALFSRGSRVTALKWAAMAALLLGFGDFHEYSPWNQLHKMPVFRSQHVPSRWEYPAALLFGVLAAALAERLLKRSGRARAVAEVAALAAAAWVAFDISRVAVQPMQTSFGTPPPELHDEIAAFHTEKVAPPALRYASDWAPPALPGEIANIATIDCSTFPGLNSYVREGLSGGIGAKGKGDPAYRGEAFTSTQKGTAEITRWTPNVVTVKVSEAVPGDLVVLNQNWDPGWLVNGQRAVNYHDATAARIDSASQEFVFRYRPRTWWLSLVVFALTVGGVVAGFRLRRRLASMEARRARAVAATEAEPRALPVEGNAG